MDRIEPETLRVAKTYTYRTIPLNETTEAYLIDIGHINPGIENLGGLDNDQSPEELAENPVIIYNWEPRSNVGHQVETAITNTERDPDFFPDQKLFMINDADIDPEKGRYIGYNEGLDIHHISRSQRHRYRRDNDLIYKPDDEALKYFEELF